MLSSCPEFANSFPISWNLACSLMRAPHRSLWYETSASDEIQDEQRFELEIRRFGKVSFRISNVSPSSYRDASSEKFPRSNSSPALFGNVYSGKTFPKKLTRGYPWFLPSTPTIFGHKQNARGHILIFFNGFFASFNHVIFFLAPCKGILPSLEFVEQHHDFSWRERRFQPLGSANIGATGVNWMVIPEFQTVWGL